MHPLNRPFVSQNTLRLEILPYLSDIIIPVLRTANITLFGNYEKEQLCEIINIMIDYCLTYVQERTVEGTYVFNLDPNIDDIVQFEGLKTQRRILPYSVKQLIAREIEVENMRRVEGVMKKEEKEKVEQKPREADKENVAANSEPVLPNHLQKLKAKTINSSPKETVRISDRFEPTSFGAFFF